MSVEPSATQGRKTRRIEAIDLARGVALIAMAIYHFSWDLELFGYVEPGLTAVGGWKLFARCIASSFLFLVGFSLFLAHANGVRWPGFLRRLAMVAAAALLITVATYFATPEAFIFFGILHEIAVASLLGLLFLRLPAIVVLVAAAAVIAAPFFLRADLFNHPALWWVGLSSEAPRSNDYVPIFPWFGAVLAGMAAAKFARQSGILDRLAISDTGRLAKPLQFAGRHSLAFYLIHQPVLISLVWLASQVVPVPAETREAQFLRGCQSQCLEQKNAAFCELYCVCVLDRLQKEGVIDAVFAQSSDAAVNDKVLESAAMCTAETYNITPEEGSQ
ncbi:MAG TPA: DUF1624 domain-containing protein [Rhizobiaceae bacterium]|nr:DUF1624 domain-containing protein [Rhizobiaceae bacterium]